MGKSIAFTPTANLRKYTYHDGYHVHIRQSVIEAMKESGFKDLVQQYWSRMSQGFFDSGIFDALIQPHVPIVDLIDAGIFSDLWAKIYCGEILWTSFNVGCKPSANDATFENMQALTELADRMFVSMGKSGTKMHNGLIGATFDGFTASVGDGLFKWNEPIEVGCQNNNVVRSKMLEPSACVLEVGTTEITTTYFHLQSSKMLARWPYDSDTIYLFSAN